MMRSNTAIKATILLRLVGLGAYVSTDPRDHAHASICRSAAAAALVGQAAVDDATILRRTLSTIIRRIAPGDATTKDFRRERITVVVDQSRIAAASCG